MGHSGEIASLCLPAGRQVRNDSLELPFFFDEPLLIHKDYNRWMLLLFSGLAVNIAGRFCSPLFERDISFNFTVIVFAVVSDKKPYNLPVDLILFSP